MDPSQHDAARRTGTPGAERAPWLAGRAPAALWPPHFGAAIFDFDGTISDTADLWRKVDEAFLGSRGFQVPADYARTLSVLGFEAGARYTIERFGLRESVEDICDEWNAMGRALYRDEARLRPGAEAYIRALRRRGVHVALATTNDPDVLNSMRGIDMEALFETRVHGKDVPVPKSKPDIYLEAARRLGAAPADCIVFEDITVGIRSARGAGMLTCGLRSNDPVQDAEEVREAADLFQEDWRDIAL